MNTKPTTAVVNVTPSQATAWLADANTRNRSLRETKVAAYARDMASGAWQFNGDPIRFATDGTLLDGQHRLSAVVRSACTVPMLVVWGLPPETQDTMDIGAHRLFRDQLQLRGEQNSGEVASITRRVIALRSGSTTLSGQNAPTNAEMVAYIEANPSIRRAAEIAVKARGRVPAAPSAIGAAYHLCSLVPDRRGSTETATTDAELFYLVQLIEMTGLYEGDPARTLLMRFQNEQMATGRQISPDDAYRYSILAWNHYRSGNKITKLQAPKGGWGQRPISPK